jgi:formylmethanofuran dehydrogenase subunit E
LGVRVAEFALEQLQVDKDVDEELLAVVETNSCGVDAIQAILGCTLGKGNLFVKDYGKAVYTIASREKNKAIRIAQRYNAVKSPASSRFGELKRKDHLTDEEQEELENLLGQIFETIMTSSFDDLFQWQEVEFEYPQKAQIWKTLQCSVCGEGVMETRASIVGEDVICPTCPMKSGGE